MWILTRHLARAPWVLAAALAAAPACAPSAPPCPTELAWTVVRAGTGAVHPSLQDRVTIRVTTRTAEGRRVAVLSPAGATEVRLRALAPGWRAALATMVAGDELRLSVPEALGYPGRSGVPHGTLVVDLALDAIAPGPRSLLPGAAWAKPPADARLDPSGIAWTRIRQGVGDHTPSRSAYALIYASDWMPAADTAFTQEDGPPMGVALDGADPAWKAMLVQMRAGERRILWPPGQAGRVVQLELVSFAEAPPPADVAAPPTGATSRLLLRGTGARRPTHTASVEAHCTAWTRDGALLGTTRPHGEPLHFGLREAGRPRVTNPCWAKGLEQMVVGEQRRYWITSQGRALTIDMELIAISPAARAGA